MARPKKGSTSLYDRLRRRQSGKPEEPGNGDVDKPGSTSTEIKLGKGRGKTKAALAVTIPAIETSMLEVEIVGTSPLIVNNFSEKSRNELLGRQMGVAKGKREKKNPFENFKGTFYVMPGKKFPKTVLKRKTTESDLGDSWPYQKDTFGIPSPAIKNAMISACRFIDGVSMTLVTGAVHVSGFLVPLKYSRVYMREDVVRVGNFPNKVADIRHRAMFTDWSIRVKIVFNSKIFKPEQIINLLENAGFHVGLCEWRPEKKGQYGMFTVGRGRKK